MPPVMPRTTRRPVSPPPDGLATVVPAAAVLATAMTSLRHYLNFRRARLSAANRAVYNAGRDEPRDLPAPLRYLRAAETSRARRYGPALPGDGWRRWARKALRH